MKITRFSIAPLLILTSLAQNAAGQNQVAIQGGRIIPIVGKVIAKGTIVIKDGKIVAIGKDVKAPVNAKVIDATGKVVMPGFVDIHNSSALTQSNETNKNVPYVSVMDGIDPNRTYFDEARRNGVTSVAVVPGNATMFGGQAAVVKTAGAFVEQMVLKRTAGMKISLRPAGRGSRMSHYANIRRELETARAMLRRRVPSRSKKSSGKKSAKKSVKKSSKKQTGGKKKSTGRRRITRSSSPKVLALLKLVRREMPAFIYCETAMDVVQATRLTTQFRLKTILVLGNDTYRAAELIAKSRLPVILSPTLVFWKTNNRTGIDQNIVLPQVFRRYKIPVTFQVSSPSRTSLGSSYLWFQAATAVKYGMPVDEALRAITLQPAKILGVSSLVGSLQVKKDGDLVILSGDPLKLDTWVEKTIINGKVVYDRSKDRKIKQLLPASKK